MTLCPICRQRPALVNAKLPDRASFGGVCEFRACAECVNVMGSLIHHHGVEGVLGRVYGGGWPAGKEKS